MKRWIAFILAVLVLAGCAQKQAAVLPKPAQVSYEKTGELLAATQSPQVGSVGGEWLVIGLAQSGRLTNAAAQAYLKNAEEYVRQIGSSRLHHAKSTENSRLILGMTAAGGDVTNVGGYNLLEGLTEMDFLKKQGNNGPIWALIAFDCGDYKIPAGDVSRDGLVAESLRVQNDDGGWGLGIGDSNVDMTAMALQALAPYRKETTVKNAIGWALTYLSGAQLDSGGFSSWGNANSESCAQVIVALTALGKDPQQEIGFVKNGNGPVDALCTFAIPDGGFCHTTEIYQMDGMATEQAYYALTAYSRFLTGQSGLYDMQE